MNRLFSYLCHRFMQYRLSHIIINISLAIIFLLFGTGYNSVVYCCSDCRSAGLEAIASSSCECVHHHHHHHDKSEVEQEEQHDNHICDFQEHHKSCTFERITVDIPVFPIQYSQQINAHFPFVLLFFAVEPPYLFDNFNELCYQAHNTPPNDTSQNVGRFLLAKKSVLII